MGTGARPVLVAVAAILGLTLLVVAWAGCSAATPRRDGAGFFVRFSFHSSPK